MFLIASSVNGSDVDDLFPGGVGKASPGQTEQAKNDQDHSKRFVHGRPPSAAVVRWTAGFYAAAAPSLKKHAVHRNRLLLKHFLDLPDFLLDHAGDFFRLTFTC